MARSCLYWPCRRYAEEPLVLSFVWECDPEMRKLWERVKEAEKCHLCGEIVKYSHTISDFNDPEEFIQYDVYKCLKCGIESLVSKEPRLNHILHS